MANASSLPAPVGYLYWYTTSLILLLLTLCNLSSILYRRFTYSRTDRLEYGTPASSTSDVFVSRVRRASQEKALALTKSHWIVRSGRVVRVLLERHVGLRIVRLPRARMWKARKTWSFPVTEILWTGEYVLGVMVLSFYGTRWDTLTWSNQTAWVAVAQIPLIIALAGKNNLISLLTGIGYEKLNFLHRAAGRVCLLGVWLHTIGHLSLTHGISSGTWHKKITHWGMTGVIAFTLVYCTSIGWVRHRLYEFFLVAHVCLVAISLAAFIMHWRQVDVWVYPGIALWAADRFLRVLRLIINNHLRRPVLLIHPRTLPTRGTLSLLTPSTLKLTFPLPSLPWSAGQHFYIVVPGMSRLPWEAHPFTACTIPESRELVFLVRVRDGFTKRMRERLAEVCLGGHGAEGEDGMDSAVRRQMQRRATAEWVGSWQRRQGEGFELHLPLPAAVEGPYGISRDLGMSDGVLIFAGGSGISYAVAHLLQIVSQAKSGRCRVRLLRIVWMVRSRLHVNWISHLLEHVHPPASLHLQIHVHITRPPIRPSNPNLHENVSVVSPSMQHDRTTQTVSHLGYQQPDPSPDDADEAEWQAYLASRSRPPSSYRSPSVWSFATWSGYQVGPSRRHSEAAIRRRSTHHREPGSPAQDKAKVGDAVGEPELQVRRKSLKPASELPRLRIDTVLHHIPARVREPRSVAKSSVIGDRIPHPHFDYTPTSQPLSRNGSGQPLLVSFGQNHSPSTLGVHLDPNSTPTNLTPRSDIGSTPSPLPSPWSADPATLSPLEPALQLPGWKGTAFRSGSRTASPLPSPPPCAPPGRVVEMGSPKMSLRTPPQNREDGEPQTVGALTYPRTSDSEEKRSSEEIIKPRSGEGSAYAASSGVVGHHPGTNLASQEEPGSVQAPIPEITYTGARSRQSSLADQLPSTDPLPESTAAGAPNPTKISAALFEDPTSHSRLLTPTDGGWDWSPGNSPTPIEDSGTASPVYGGGLPESVRSSSLDVAPTRSQSHAPGDSEELSLSARADPLRSRSSVIFGANPGIQSSEALRDASSPSSGLPIGSHPVRHDNPLGYETHWSLPPCLSPTLTLPPPLSPPPASSSLASTYPSTDLPISLNSSLNPSSSPPHPFPFPQCIIFHTARAPIKSTVDELRNELDTGLLAVHACGPRGLLDAVREAVRKTNTVERVWSGEVRVEFYAETFGW